MAIQIPAASRQAACDAIVDQLDSLAGTLEIRTGSAPDPDSAVTGTLLATITLQAPAFGAADSDGIATLLGVPLEDSSADDTGTAGYFRVETNAGACVYQGSVGTSGEDLNLTSVSIVATESVTVTSLTLQVPQNQS